MKSIVAICLLLLSVNAFAANETSSNPEDWYFYKTEPRKIDFDGDSWIQKEYIFQKSEKKTCIRDCPYKFPAWDGSANSVNKALTHIGLPPITDLVPYKNKYGNDKFNQEFTCPNYPLGEIIIFKGKYTPPHLWKVMVKEK